MDAKGQFRSLAEPWADTGTGRLMLAVLGGLADVERATYPHTNGRGHGSTPFPHTGTAERGHQTPRATLEELADSYDRSISTMRRATRA